MVDWSATHCHAEMSAWLLWNLDDDQQLRQRLPLLAARSLEYVVWPAAVSRIGRRRS
jgi:hypothetical protein